MKQIKLMALVAIIAGILAACSSPKTDSTATDESTAPAVSAPTGLNYERIATYESFDESKMTEEDYDFLLDQMEIIINKANELPADQAKNYVKYLDTEDQKAAGIIAIAIGFTSDSKWTDAQKARLRELESHDPSKK